MHNYEIQPLLKKKLKKILKKDKKLYFMILNKIEEIINSKRLKHYKNLRHDLKGRKRIHIGHFVLIFRFIKLKRKIIFIDFDHHDKIYNG